MVWSFAQFERFWKHAKERHRRGRSLGEPLLHVGSYWEFWKKEELLVNEEVDLERAIRLLARDQGEQERFVEEIESWGRTQDPDFPSSAGWIVLHQLSELPEFAAWQALHPYRPSGFEGVNAVVVRGSNPPAAGEVKPIRVVFLEQGAAHWDPLNADFLDHGTMADVQRAVTRCLGGPSFPAFVLSWAIFGWTLRPSAARIASVLLAGIALISVAVARTWSPLSRSLLHASLWTLAVAAMGILAIALAALALEYSAARRQRKRVNGARAVIVLGGDSSDPRVQVRGASVGAALYLSTLQALYRDVATDGSALSWCAQIAADRLRTAAFTGSLTSGDRLKSVDLIEEKIAACDSHSRVSTLYVPFFQRIPRVGRTRSHVRVRRVLPFLPLPIATQPLGIREHLTAVASVLAAGVLALACFDAWSILDSPPGPHLLIEKSGFHRDLEANEDLLALSFTTPRSPRFSVCLNSHYWANRCGRIFEDSSGISRVDLHMDRLRQPMVWDKYDGELEIVYSAPFLGRKLLPVIVERLLLEHVAVPGWDIGLADSQ